MLAVYQPHGYGPDALPARGLRETRSPTTLRPDDRLWLLEIFYAGGTAVRDFSSADIVRDIAARGAHAEFAPSREALIERIAEAAEPGDLVLVMGARDPSLTEFARAVRARLASGR